MLIHDLSVPEDMICVEVRLSHYGLKSNQRADIVIKGLTKEQELIPIALIECKAPGVGLDEKVTKQMINYSDALGCDYAIMINDTEYFSYHYEEAGNKYIQINKIPSYQEMIWDHYVLMMQAKFLIE